MPPASAVLVFGSGSRSRSAGRATAVAGRARRSLPHSSSSSPVATARREQRAGGPARPPSQCSYGLPLQATMANEAEESDPWRQPGEALRGWPPDVGGPAKSRTGAGRWLVADGHAVEADRDRRRSPAATGYPDPAWSLPRGVWYGEARHGPAPRARRADARRLRPHVHTLGRARGRADTGGPQATAPAFAARVLRGHRAPALLSGCPANAPRFRLACDARTAFARGHVVVRALYMLELAIPWVPTPSASRLAANLLAGRCRAQALKRVLRWCSAGRLSAEGSRLAFEAGRDRRRRSRDGPRAPPTAPRRRARDPSAPSTGPRTPAQDALRGRPARHRRRRAQGSAAT